MILIAVFQMASAGRTTSEFESICLDISLQVILAPCLATSPVDNLAFRESRFRDEGLAYVKDVKLIDQFDRSQDVAEAVEVRVARLPLATKYILSIVSESVRLYFN